MGSTEIALPIALIALSLALLAYSKNSNNKDIYSIDWEKALRYLTIPTMVIIGIVGFLYIGPQLNTWSAKFGAGATVDFSYLFILPVVIIPITIAIGAIAMFVSNHREKKLASNNTEKKAQP